MDIRTLIIVLAIGNLVFGAALVLFHFRQESARRNSFLTAAKFLQSAGWFLIELRGEIPDVLSFTIGNISLLSGFAYDCWAMFRISGKSVGRRLQLASVVFVTVACVLATFADPSVRISVASFVSVLFFSVSAWAMLSGPPPKSLLRLAVGVTMTFIAVVVVVRGVYALLVPGGLALFSRDVVQEVTFWMTYVAMMTNGVGLLLLMKEGVDREVRELLEEKELVLRTLPNGLCVTRERIIIACNPAMERMFGFAPGTLVGKSVRVLYASDADFEESGRRIYSEMARDGRFVGEIPYVRQDGERFWALDHGATIFPERAKAHAVYSITDITEQKREQEVLAMRHAEAESALARVKRLEGIIAICMYCKKIRNRQDSWDRIEKYITENSDAMFSHSICPECEARHHP